LALLTENQLPHVVHTAVLAMCNSLSDIGRRTTYPNHRIYLLVFPRILSQ